MLLEGLREAIIPDSHRKQVEEAGAQMKETAEVKGICYLARREQTYAYEPNYAVSGVRRAR